MAPQAISDLKVAWAHIHMASLTWTAPADVGTSGCALYDVRFSTSPIDASNWDQATQANGEPVPAVAGTEERVTVDGLDADTLYYFAVKTADWAEPANVSDLSNVVSATTLLPVSPVVLRNPWIVNDRVADCRNEQTMGATFANAYSPDGVTPPANDQDKAINLYNNMKRRVYHWAATPPNNSDLIAQLNVFGWCLCGTHAALDTQMALDCGLDARIINVQGHNFYEAGYNGTWHAMDTMTTMYVFNRATPPSIASLF